MDEHVADSDFESRCKQAMRSVIQIERRKKNNNATATQLERAISDLRIRELREVLDKLKVKGDLLYFNEIRTGKGGPWTKDVYMTPGRYKRLRAEGLGQTKRTD